MHFIYQKMAGIFWVACELKEIVIITIALDFLYLEIILSSDEK